MTNAQLYRAPNLPHVFITRHGKCVHNAPGMDHLWTEYSNDDIMGLTVEGIRETAEKAQYLAHIFNRNFPLVIVATESLRSQQTASLLHSELRNKFGFDNAFVKTGAKEFNEVPRPTASEPLPSSFDFKEFKEDPEYSILGETFAGRMKKYIEWMSDGRLANTLQGFVPYGPFEECQILIVGHHYSLSAFFGAAGVFYASQTARDLVDLGRALVGCAHRYYLHHSDLLYISSLLRREELPQTLFQESAMYTRQALNRHFHL